MFHCLLPACIEIILPHIHLPNFQAIINGAPPILQLQSKSFVLLHPTSVFATNPEYLQTQVSCF